MTSDLSPSQLICEITAKAHQRANCILRCFVKKYSDLFVRAAVTFVRPILEYNSVVVSAWLKHNIGQIEKVQRRFTKLV